MGWYLVITEEMRASGLSGNDLMVFALINGYSQSGQGYFFGSISYICETCGISRSTAIRTLQELTEKGLITKKESFINGVKSVTYQVKGGGVKLTPGVSKCNGGGIKMTPNNKEDNKYISLSIIKETGKFKVPTLEEVREYCRERGNNVDPEQFINFYESKGWMVGKSKMRDWKASVRTWEKRDNESPKPHTAPKPHTESTYEHNLKEYDSMFNSHQHEMNYGRQYTDTDEQ